MKKMLVYALLVALVMSLAVPAAAATNSATGSFETLKPEVVTDGDLVIYSAEETKDLSEEEQEIFAEAKTALKEAAPEGMAARYFVYCEGTGSATLDVGEYEEVVIMQFVNGEWVELEFTINADGTITIEGITAAPMAIFVK